MIYNDILTNVINKDKSLDNGTKLILTNYLKRLNDDIQLILEPSLQELNSWKTGLIDKKISLGNITNTNKFVVLHDNTFLVFRDNAPALQFDQKGTLIRQFPFEYGSVSDLNTSYENVIDVKEISFLDTNVTPAKQTTVIGVVMAGTHLVRLYQYMDKVWSYLTSIGEHTNNGYTGNLLDTPTALGMQVKDTDTTLKLELVIANNGNSPNSQPSFLKYFKVLLTGTIDGAPQIISYPGINNLGITGSLNVSETQNVKNLFLKDNLLYISNQNGNEFGIAQIQPNLTILSLYVKSLNIQTLDNGDVLNIPTAFVPIGNEIVCGDNLGHVFRLPNDLSNTSKFVGITKPTNSSVFLPFYFSAIKDIRVIGSNVYLLTDNTIRVVNLLDWEQKEFVFTIDPLKVGYKIEYIFGFTDKGEIYLSLNDEEFLPVHSFIALNQYVQPHDTLKVKIVCSEENFLKTPKLLPGILILNPVN